MKYPCQACGGTGRNQGTDGQLTITDHEGRVLAVHPAPTECRWCHGTGRERITLMRDSGHGERPVGSVDREEYEATRSAA